MQLIYNSRYQGYKSALKDLQAQIEKVFKKISIWPSIKSRVKSFKSYYRKKITKAKNTGFPEQGCTIPDMLGIRIVCPFLEDIKEIEMVLGREFQILDYEQKGSSSFREFGYESTHLIIKVPPKIIKKHNLEEDLICEVQIRTILQDAWAEVEHELVYKAEFSPFDEPLKRKLAALNANLTLSDIIFQEIRNYQRQLHLELKKRRGTFFEEVRKLSSIQPNGRVYRAAEGESSSDDKNTEAKESHFKAAASESKTIDDLLLEALYAHNSHKITQAIEIYTYILSLKPGEQLQPIIYIHRGMAYFSQSRYSLAMEDFSEALSLNPENDKALYYRGVMYSIIQDYPKALADLNRCINLNPSWADPLLSRAQVYFHLGDNPKALTDCEEALSLEPGLEQLISFRNFIRSEMEL
ncbi:MAG: tetratricopeptide repeat protein [Spirochaeta sp.]|nr:tetratricopeptide repeat protein [Spirochaeta sp.]